MGVGALLEKEDQKGLSEKIALIRDKGFKKKITPCSGGVAQLIEHHSMYQGLLVRFEYQGKFPDYGLDPQ